MGQESLVSISEASRILAVSEAALRQWTDEGKVKAFITPGGHRRYSRDELRKFMTMRQKVLGVEDLAIELEDTVELHRDIGRAYVDAAGWYQKLEPGTQAHIVDLGRQLLNVIIRHAMEPSKREETTRLARQVGADFGVTLAGVGLPLTDTVDAFIRHRDPVMSATTRLMRRKGVLNSRVAQAIPMVARTMDEALVSLVAAYESRWPSRMPNIGGGE